MIAVSNTTPLRYLLAIQHEHLLPKLFAKVFIPNAVFKELTETSTPDIVRQCILARPPWLEVRAVSQKTETPFPVILHPGEHESILLAELLRPDVILIDELAGRTVALNRNLPLSGTLGLLERADKQGLLSDFSQTLKQLKASGFYITETLEKQLLKRHAARRPLK